MERGNVFDALSEGFIGSPEPICTELFDGDTGELTKEYCMEVYEFSGQWYQPRGKNDYQDNYRFSAGAEATVWCKGSDESKLVVIQGATTLTTGALTLLFALIN